MLLTGPLFVTFYFTLASDGANSRCLYATTCHRSAEMNLFSPVFTTCDKKTINKHKWICFEGERKQLAASVGPAPGWRVVVVVGGWCCG